MISPGQPARDLVPRGVCEWIAMQQEKRRSRATMPEEDIGATGADPLCLEALEQARIGRERGRRHPPRRGLGERVTGADNALRSERAG